MWRRFETFEAGSDFLAWASTVAFCEAKNFLRVAGWSPLRFSDELLQTLASDRLSDTATLAASLGRAPQTVYNKLSIIWRCLADCVTQRMLEGGT